MFSHVPHSSKEWFLQKHPEQLQNLFGKIFVFCFVWSFGGILRREDDSEDDGGISVAPRGEEKDNEDGTNKKKGESVEINISYEFDGFVHDMFDTEPPLGEFSILNHPVTIFSLLLHLQLTLITFTFCPPLCPCNGMLEVHQNTGFANWI